jgi:SAM-dependent methyltransferase
MTDWTSGYVADIDYTYDFFRELTPSHLAFCATSKGHDHGLGREALSYCELGCGQGYSANLLAAANPHIEFHAMDFNPAHIAGATRLAEDAGLANMHFHERAFEDFGETPGLPEQFDIIALHGVYSWVSKENRQLITDFIAKRLKSGGMVYISYNALPGWAPALPLRRILASRGALGTGPVEDRLNDAMGFARQLEQSGADYFAVNPALGKKLDQMQTMSANYLAHEYMNKDWNPFHFEDIAADMAQAKLKFLCSADPLDHVEDAALTPGQIAVLEGEADPVRREGLRDIMLNEQFRTDIFVKGHMKHSQRSAIGAWFETPMALARAYHGGPVKLQGRRGEVALEQAHYGPLLAALAEGPLTVRAMLEQGVFGSMGWEDISRMLTLLAGAGYLAPCLPQAGLAERAERCRAFNLAVCKRAEESDTLRFLASPVTGGGIAADRLEQLFLLARSEGLQTPEDWAALAWQIMAPQGQRLEKDGKFLESAEENLALLRQRAQTFAARRLRFFEILGLTLEAPAPAATAARDGGAAAAA